ncbi:dTDP-4-dehydrorhamnose 3,5-epimerase [Tenggerimyces flavus]|uniref:dTDP-4-dehydrorhamnose 3,5-epimerase n=1 Tax=Tenggerimyces flavus TaxID=1708749 RepID=A0ABV7YEL0_9ACTN|nr:dTDP-4-dehydrorhamnose 3,5-epimerase [Tenggerimyces flavus]MBM7786973.1 dTDP-4-dehydrorhamnose 3,5-epimerase [Tenggerimyces flavus]
MQPLSIPGAFVVDSPVIPDARGSFNVWFSSSGFRAAVGHSFTVAQANCSVSARGVVRGLHYADVPPSQAKLVTCVRGAVLDVVVDLRVGSPTYRRWEFVELNEATRRSVYVGEGLGHGFVSLTDDATVIYLCSSPYTPEREHAVSPFDPDLAIPWPREVEPILSDKDAAALSLAEAEGLLPRYEDCLNFHAELVTRDEAAQD